jgi:general secretion pathway protein L
MINRLNINEAIKWWITGLGYLYPASIRKLFNGFPELITIEFTEQQVLFKRFTDNMEEAHEIRDFNTKDEARRISVINWLQELKQNKPVISLIIPDECLLNKKMSYPIAASSNLRQVISFEMNRKTPFKPEQTYFDYLLIEDNEEWDKVSLELFLVPRDRINPYLEMLESWGIKLDAIRPAIHYDNDSINLIAREERSQDSVKADKILLILTAITCLLFIAVLYAPIINQQKELTFLENTLFERRKDIYHLKPLIQDEERLFKQSHFLKDIRVSKMSSIKLINEVTQIITDDTWLTRLVMTSDELQLQGESSNATSLIQILESSDYFTDVKFRSPVIQNKINNKDKFYVSAKLKWRNI